MPCPTKADEFAPAKINLTLHVTGRRRDGYHDLDSLVVFAGTGDRLRATLSQDMTLDITGPRATGVPADPSNLVWRAAALFDPPVNARLVLDKHLPSAAGIGGGSADAAATLRLLARLAGRALPPADRVLSLGADVPVCLSGVATRMRGIGDRLDPVPPLPPLFMVLVNPGVALSTPAVFKAMAAQTGPAMVDPLPVWSTPKAFLDWLSVQRNDLQAAAQSLTPDIGRVLDGLEATVGCRLARMSGSGATCFGLYDHKDPAEMAAASIRRAHPDWWCVAAPMLG
ncbi:4-(cytidine 5'-diphospho)-2-C-methyl-D-erythritol kinase [Pseudoruegeria sp. SK021]|uniref:4-(cytidine 5'-diphospho)-2-C-methyl-D-erythritol kinase n=1 Tax=Pseudoruegeria sp. SK021 TaxID=1933035 RepID=UPI000A22F8E1|nr:4-(cytidine 5'-diphospho)-2-C-methyl-D-erythritol kinase [Pseudoruegeria sp. SK021]OSP55659.1 4-(cytidine 5'-diphospho)-2-C-methyl-D-erythritol kinase [Pseudoruegeria sp. SK021]